MPGYFVSKVLAIACERTSSVEVYQTTVPSLRAVAMRSGVIRLTGGASASAVPERMPSRVPSANAALMRGGAAGVIGDRLIVGGGAARHDRAGRDVVALLAREVGLEPDEIVIGVERQDLVEDAIQRMLVLERAHD